jgi:5-methylcytosine-specific restriction protein A
VPTGARRPCLKPGCRALVPSGFCPEHQHIRVDRERARKAAVDARRSPSLRARYTSPEWRKARAEFLADHPACADTSDGHVCGARATVVDHVKPWRTQPNPDVAFWDRTNWAPICWHHHSRKTCKTDGGFGHTRVIT